MMNYAGFWLRFLAFIIDSIILAMLGIITGFLLGIVFGGAGANNADAGLTTAELIVQGINMAVSLVMNWLYYALQESSDKQATIGKQALGIIVRDVNGEPITFGKATIRYFAQILSGLTLGIGYVMAAFTQRKQALHDMIAGTLVLKH
jgi:uncharacterized RDD family membrane protein YckC